MAAAHARRIAEETKKKVCIIDRYGRPRWNEVWENLPYISPSITPGSFPYQNGAGCRPYIRSHNRAYYEFVPGTMVGPGEIRFSQAETERIRERRKRLSDFVIIEPNTKLRAPPNKNWGLVRFIQLKDLLRDFRLVQVGPPGTALLEGVEFIQTNSFREALGVLSISRAYVGNEGGLHHAAAALGIPAVVIFGGFISPAVTGYEKPNGAEHRNLFIKTEEHPNGCGWRSICAHCQWAMNKITPSVVASELRSVVAASAAFSKGE